MLTEVKEIKGLFVFEPRVFEDERGYFFESYNERLFTEAGINFKVVQQNQSRSEYGTIRGLHYQAGEHPQAKFVRVVKGKILDVAVDIRSDSPTYGKHYAIELSDKNKKGLFIPYGFAHGFSALSDDTEVVYLCDEFYCQKSEGGIKFDDPQVNIDWLIKGEKINVSDKDNSQPSFERYKRNPKF